MKVKNMLSTQGNKIANQFEMIDDMENTWFQSYDSIIAVKLPLFNGGIILDEYYWDYSRTTSKYRNIFLNMNTSEIKKAIRNGQIKLMDLNCDNPLKDIVYEDWGYEVFKGTECVDNWYESMQYGKTFTKAFKTAPYTGDKDEPMFMELIKYKCLVTNVMGHIDELERITKGKVVHTNWKSSEIYEQLNMSKEDYIKMLYKRVEETNNPNYYFVRNGITYNAHREINRLKEVK